jgi:predicted nucleic acid-binding protein
MARLVLSEASPLIGLALVNGLRWLPQLFGAVGLPREVEREVLSGWGAPREAAIRQALRDGWLYLVEPTPALPELPDMDEGEAACIRIGLALGGAALVLMDERAGRAVALEHGLNVAGTAAVIGTAKGRGLIPSARAVFEMLHQSDFRISAEVVRVVLARVGE